MGWDASGGLLQTFTVRVVEFSEPEIPRLEPASKDAVKSVFHQDVKSMMLFGTCSQLIHVGKTHAQKHG